MKPEPSFSDIMDTIKYLDHLRPGEAYESFFQSIVNDFVKNGYTEVKAKEVINEMLNVIRNNKK